MKSGLKVSQILLGVTASIGLMSQAGAVVIDFNGGTAYLSGGGSVVITNAGPVYNNVDYYVEDGIRVDFIGGLGTVGDYYGDFPNNIGLNNGVIHAHWELGLTAVRFTKVDGSAFDLNYVDLSSNTVIGGGAATGAELSYITPFSGVSTLLPSSDWGINFLSTGAPGDGIERLYLDSAFDQILGFDVTSLNAYCFGLDNFFIDEEPPPRNVPEPTTLGLFGLLLMGLGFASRRKRQV
jgi:PEP-CTERM motif